MKRHQFEQHARHFRSGRISLNELTDLVFGASKEVAVVVGDKSDEADAIVATIDNDVSIPALKSRPHDAHKGDFGRVLLVGGSSGMAGAISLSAMAALRTGSGLVTAAVPESIAEIVAGFDPCMMTIACRDSDGHFSSMNSDELKQQLESADVIAMGPGMGREVDRYFVKAMLDVEQPLVIDADGLYLLDQSHALLATRNGPTVLTPHPGEFSNLANKRFEDRKSMEEAAIEFAADKNCVVVLKGHNTLVTNGSRNFRNGTGNPGMATAGSGDVLTGVISSLIGQGFDPFEAAVLGVHLHGRAGDFAAEKFGTVSIVATDILNCLALALKSHVAVGTEIRIGF